MRTPSDADPAHRALPSTSPPFPSGHPGNWSVAPWSATSYPDATQVVRPARSLCAAGRRTYPGGVPSYSAREIYRFARMAGFSPDQSATMTAVALAESGGNSGAHNSSGEDSRGLWQINAAAHPNLRSVDLYDPVSYTHLRAHET